MYCIKLMLSFLTDKEMELVKIRLGNNLKEQLDSQNVPKKVNTSKFYNEFYKSLVPKMRNILKELTKNNNFSEEKINAAIKLYYKIHKNLFVSDDLVYNRVKIGKYLLSKKKEYHNKTIDIESFIFLDSLNMIWDINKFNLINSLKYLTNIKSELLSTLNKIVNNYDESSIAHLLVFLYKNKLNNYTFLNCLYDASVICPILNKKLTDEEYKISILYFNNIDLNIILNAFNITKEEFNNIRKKSLDIIVNNSRLLKINLINKSLKNIKPISIEKTKDQNLKIDNFKPINKKVTKSVQPEKIENKNLNLGNTPQINHNVKSSKKSGPKLKSIYERLSEYPREKVDEVLDKLSQYDKELLKINYGEDLEHPKRNSNCSKYQKNKLNNILIPKMKEALENPENIDSILAQKSGTKLKSIYERLSEYPREKVDEVLDKLSSKDKELIKMSYGEDLDNPKRNPNFSQYQRNKLNIILIPKMKEALENPENIENIFAKKSGTKLKSIYERLSEYPREKVDEVLDKLPSEDEELIKMSYGEDLDHPKRSKEFNALYSTKLNNILIPKMKEALENPENIDNIFARKKRNKKLKSIYERFSEYSREQVDEVLDKLPQKDEELIKMGYGEDLDHPKRDPNFSQYQKNKLNNILIPKMREALENPKNIENIFAKKGGLKLKSIYERFSEYSREQVDEVLDKLPSEDKELIKICYGEDLDHPKRGEKFNHCNKNKLNNILIPKMREALENPKNIDNIFVRRKSGPKLKSIYERFSEYSREQVDEVLDKLSPKDEELIKICYGEDLDHPKRSKKFENFHSYRINNILIPKIKEALENPENIDNIFTQESYEKLKSIYERLSEYSREQVDEVLDKLPSYDKELIKLCYGEDLDHPKRDLSFKRYHKNKLNNILIPKMKEALENPENIDNILTKKGGPKLKNIYERLSKYPREKVDEVLDKLPPKDKKIIKMCYGEDLEHPKRDPNFSIYHKNKLNSTIIPQMREALENPENIDNIFAQKNGSKLKSIYERFSEYSREQVDEVLDKLPSYDKELIKLCYGEDLDHPKRSKEFKVNHSSKLNRILIPQMREAIENPENIDNIFTQKTGPKLKSIYERLSEYPREKVDEVLDKLSSNDKKLIKLCYGENLDHPKRSENFVISNSVNLNISILPKIRKALEDPKNIDNILAPKKCGPKLKSIYERFSEYSREQIDEVLDKLPPKDEELIKICYGEDLDHPKRNPSFSRYHKTKLNNNLIPQMKEALENPKNIDNIFAQKSGTKLKSIYERLSKYPREQIDEVLDKLPPKDEELIKICYGEDLDNPKRSKEFEKIHSYRINNILLPKLRKILEDPENIDSILTKKGGPKLKSIYERLSEYPREKVDEVLDKLPPKDKEIIKICYGENLDHPIRDPSFSLYHKNKLNNILIPKIKKNLENKNKINYEYKLSPNSTDIKLKNIIIENDLKLNNFGILLTGELNNDELLIALLKFGVNISIKDIANYLNIKEMDVKKIIKKVLIIYKKNINQYIDNIVKDIENNKEPFDESNIHLLK